MRVFLAQLGVTANTHKFAINKSGSVNASVIIEISTGEKVEIPSRQKMAAVLGTDDTALYEVLYRPLSSFVHSDINNFHHFIDDDGFDYLNQDFAFEVLLSSLFLSMLLVSTLRAFSPCQQYLKKDLLTATGKALFAILLSDKFMQAHGAGKLTPIFEKYIVAIAREDQLLATIYSSIRELDPEKPPTPEADSTV